MTHGEPWLLVTALRLGTWDMVAAGCCLRAARDEAEAYERGKRWTGRKEAA
jgi:hypothetical protein